jgi:hypothetical protein
MTFFWQNPTLANPRRIEHAVWPTDVPPVSPFYWTQADWDRFAERYRPDWYRGGIHDERAWRAALAARRGAKR